MTYYGALLKDLPEIPMYIRTGTGYMRPHCASADSTTKHDIPSDLRTRSCKSISIVTFHCHAGLAETYFHRGVSKPPSGWLCRKYRFVSPCLFGLQQFVTLCLNTYKRRLQGDDEPLYVLRTPLPRCCPNSPAESDPTTHET